jgi:PAS domain S-box-containing protein
VRIVQRHGKTSTQGAPAASDITNVSNAASLTENDLSAPTDKKSSAGRWILVMGITVLLLTIAGSIWIYTESAGALGRISRTHGQVPAGPKVVMGEDMVPAMLVDGWVRQLSIATAAGGAGFLVLVATGVWGWRHLWVRRVRKLARELEETSRQAQQSSSEAQRVFSDRRRIEEELNRTVAEMEQRIAQRTTHLSSSYAQLQKELSDRRQAERAMAQQAKELERSKDVLEMHVQVRTQELQKLQRRTESILNSAGEGIYGLDLQGKINFVNPAAAKISGWKVEEMVGRFEQEIFLRGQPSADALQKDANGEHLADQVFFRRDSQPFPVEYVRTPIKEKERLVGAVVIFKDITERKRSEEAINRKAAELARSNAELEQFAYVASHDLQEPLRKIQAFGDRLKAKCEAVNLQEGRDYLERMQGAAARMQTLINDLLTFSRVISSSQPFVEVDLNTVVKGVLSDLEVRIEQCKATLEIGQLPNIEADPMQMRQLFQNLIGNALKFQPPINQPVIRIQAHLIANLFAGAADQDLCADQCEITIQDNGIGFDEKYLEKIFAVFQRLHGRNEYEGTGVGLAVCRRITDRHGGSITAMSKPGEGATFVVTLPVRHPKKEKEPASG